MTPEIIKNLKVMLRYFLFWCSLDIELDSPSSHFLVSILINPSFDLENQTLAVFEKNWLSIKWILAHKVPTLLWTIILKWRKNDYSRKGLHCMNKSSSHFGVPFNYFNFKIFSCRHILTYFNKWMVDLSLTRLYIRVYLFWKILLRILIKL